MTTKSEITQNSSTGSKKHVSLDEFLLPISKALGRQEVPDKPASSSDLPAETLIPERATDGLGQEELVELFISEAQKIHISVHRIEKENLISKLAEIIKTDEDQAGYQNGDQSGTQGAQGGAQSGTQGAHDEAQGETQEQETQGAQGGAQSTPQTASVIVEAGEKLSELCNLEDLSKNCGEAQIKVWDSLDSQACIDFAKEADFGIHYASGAIAETGTVVHEVNEKSARSVSLLPLNHISIIEVSSITATLGSYLKKVQARVDVDNSDLPSQICFISGPSATSDIELVRVEGVHGPMYEHYVIIN